MAVPTIDPIVSHTAHPGVELSFFVNAFDADDDDMTFVLINNPPNAANIDPNSGRFSWIPTTAHLVGSPHQLTVQVSTDNGDTATLNFTITVTNQGPIIDPISAWTAYVNRQLLFVVNARDPDGDVLNYTLVTGPASAYIDPNSGQFSWIPTTRGSFQATVRVTDTSGASATSAPFAITVISTPPTLDPLPVGMTAHPTIPFTFNAVGIDADGDALTYTLAQGPTNSYVDPNSGLFSWMPEWNQWIAGQANNHTIRITVTDIAGQSQTRQGSVTVVNHSPTIVAIPARTAYAGQQLRFSVNASDPDGDPVMFSLVNPPAGAYIDANSGLFFWTPPATALGAVTITVRAADPGGMTFDTQFTVNVINDPPVLETPPTRTGHPGKETTFNANAYDRDGDYLTYRITAGPNNAWVDPNSGRFSFTPTWAQLGSHQITLEVADPSNLTDSKQFTIVVSNQAPAVESIPNRVVDPDDTLEFYVNASDPDGDNLTFSLTGNVPPGASIDQNSGYFHWMIPANTPAGAYPITVRVTDSDLSTDSQFVVTVNGAPPPPAPPSHGGKPIFL